LPCAPYRAFKRFGSPLPSRWLWALGANAAIFSVVRAVLLRPLANRDEDRLLYVRQSAPGLKQVNTTFSVPEIKDLGTGLKTIQELGTFF